MRVLRVAVLLCAVSLPLAAQGAARTSRDYLGFLPSKALDTLYSTGEVTGIAATINDLPLWQSSPFAGDIRAALAGFSSTIAAEGFFLIDAPRAADPAGIDAKIFNSFTAFSSLKGLQVYSVSKGRPETFLFDASRVDPADRTRRLPDTLVTEVPPQAEFVVYENEEQTGDSYVRFQFRHGEPGDPFLVSVENLSAMHWLAFTLVEPGNLRTYFTVVPFPDHLVLYGLTTVKTARLLGLERVKEKSFYYRLRALVSWFAGNVGK
ncbi:MAG TPA: DUF6675 family protein [Spirochaetia bacterium]|nr:DUF6675 family protein [Spirochaetia bacterium]